jgi:hypothetical protein
METPLLTVIVPTVGRPSLARTVRSLLRQGEWLPWEAILVGDTHAGTWAEQLPLARALAAQHPERLRYVEHDGGLHAWGHPQRNFGATVARGRWLSWLGDDDVYLPGAFETLGRVLRRQEDDPRVLLFRWIAPWKQVLWAEAGRLQQDYVDAEMIVCPNVPERLGVWNPARYQGDFDFIKETSDHWNGPERVLWQPEVIAQAQPSETEDWTLGGREAPPVDLVWVGRA